MWLFERWPERDFREQFTLALERADDVLGKCRRHAVVFTAVGLLRETGGVERFPVRALRDREMAGFDGAQHHALARTAHQAKRGGEPQRACQLRRILVARSARVFDLMGDGTEHLGDRTLGVGAMASQTRILFLIFVEYYRRLGFTAHTLRILHIYLQNSHGQIFYILHYVTVP